MLRALLALLLSFPDPAAACRICSAPGTEPPPSEAPRAPYDLRSPAPLTPEETKELVALDGGRYAIKGSHVVDLKAADPAAHLLSNERITEFLTERSKKITTELKNKYDNGTFEAADRLTAIGLYWSRGPLLPDPQREFLAKIAAAAKGKAPASPGETRSGEPGVAPADAPAGEDALTARLLAQLELVDHGNPEEAAGLDMAVRRLMSTPTGRELAEEFVSHGKKVRVSFETVPGSKVVETNGKKMIEASGGSTSFEGAIPHVRLNKDYLGTDPDFQRFYLPGTLGHELLGHGLEQIKAEKAGLGRPYLAYRSNEANAGMVGWLVEAELGAKLINPHMWNYLRSPEEYHRTLKTNLAYYAGTFSPDEMADPVPVLKERLVNAKAALAALERDKTSMESWRPIIAHFKIRKFDKDHGFRKPDSSFSAASQDIENFTGSGYPRRRAEIQEIVDYVGTLINWYSGKDAAADLAALKKAAESNLFKEAERNLETRKIRLEGVIRARSARAAAAEPPPPASSAPASAKLKAPEPPPSGPERFAPPADDQISWDDLYRLHQTDLARFPKHWPKS